MLTPILGGLYGLGMLFFSLAFLIDWVKFRRAVGRYQNAAGWIAVAVIGLDVVTVVSAGTSADVLVALVIDVILFVRVLGFAMVGLTYAVDLGQPGAPWLLGLARAKAAPDGPTSRPPATTLTPGPDALSTPSVIATPMAGTGPTGDEAGVQTALPASVPRRWEARSVPVALGVALVAILYSVGLFLLTRPHLSAGLQRIQSANPGAAAVTWSWSSVLVMLTVALSEEVFFRLGIQTFLEKRLHLTGARYGIAMVLTALLWALGHVGMLDPDWVKLVQIFPIGLLLGGLYRKYGVEASVLAHGVFNLVMLFLGSSLVN